MEDAGSGFCLYNGFVGKACFLSPGKRMVRNVEEKVRVLVVDDQNVARTFFELYVQAFTDYELVKALPSAELAVEYCNRYPVDLVVMDVMMRYGMDGLTAAQKIKEAHPRIKIILATSTLEASWEEKAREIGVESFWYKEFNEVPLQDVMNRTMAGESVYPEDSPSVSFGMAKRADLTPRELDVLRELTNSATNEEIAEKLNISAHTVKTHIQNMLVKTGFENRLDLAIHAKALGLVVSERDRLSK